MVNLVNRTYYENYVNSPVLIISLTAAVLLTLQANNVHVHHYKKLRDIYDELNTIKV